MSVIPLLAVMLYFNFNIPSGTTNVNGHLSIAAAQGYRQDLGECLLPLDIHTNVNLTPSEWTLPGTEVQMVSGDQAGHCMQVDGYTETIVRFVAPENYDNWYLHFAIKRVDYNSPRLYMITIEDNSPISTNFTGSLKPTLSDWWPVDVRWSGYGWTPVSVSLNQSVSKGEHIIRIIPFQQIEPAGKYQIDNIKVTAWNDIVSGAPREVGGEFIEIPDEDFTAKDNKWKIKPWASLSTLWGQGGVGLQLQNSPLRQWNLSYNFVADWLDGADFTYHEVALSVRQKNATLGMKYRHQLSQDEWTPFVAYFIPFEKLVLPMSIYNEAEYRFNSAFKPNDYLRTRHVFTIYAPNWFHKKFYLRPYVAFDAFWDWDDVEYEKLRLSVGYFIYLKQATVRAYYIPWSTGIEEENWDDKHSFGASVTFHL